MVIDMNEKMIIYNYSFDKWDKIIKIKAKEVKETNKLFIAISGSFSNYTSRISKEMLDVFQTDNYRECFMISKSNDKLDYFKSEVIDYYSQKIDECIAQVNEYQKIIDGLQGGDSND